jgi:hypothetical protein
LKLLSQAETAIGKIGTYPWIASTLLQAKSHGLVMRLQAVGGIDGRRTVAGQVAIQVGVAGGNTDGDDLARDGGRGRFFLAGGVMATAQQ